MWYEVDQLWIVEELECVFLYICTANAAIESILSHTVYGTHLCSILIGHVV